MNIIKRYIRTTHNYDNDTREWVYRGDTDRKDWRNKFIINRESPRWSLGVHGLSRDKKMTLEEILDATITYFNQDPEIDFSKFIAEHPNYRDLVMNDILDDLEFLMHFDMVRCYPREDVK